MPRMTKEHSEMTRASILATARGLFAGRGYADVGLQEVASAAGVTRGAVYHHFDSKIGLFTEVHGLAQREVADEIERQTAGINDLWHSLEIGCRAFLTTSVSDRFRRVLLLDGPAVLGWGTWRSLDAANSGSLLDSVLSELHSAGELTVAPRAASALLSGAMNEAVLAMADANGSAEAPGAEEVWEVLQRFLQSLRMGG